jgi:hypothetical protein
MLSSASAVLLAAATLPLLSSANPLPRQATRPAKRSTFFHNTQNASNTEFNPLHHLAGIAPYFDSPGVELNPSESCCYFGPFSISGLEPLLSFL